jgi:hypothetical protein
LTRITPRDRSPPGWFRKNRSKQPSIDAGARGIAERDVENPVISLPGQNKP